MRVLSKKQIQTKLGKIFPFILTEDIYVYTSGGYPFRLEDGNLACYYFYYEGVVYIGNTSRVAGFFDKIPICEDSSLDSIQKKMESLQVNNTVYCPELRSFSEKVSGIVYPGNASIILGLCESYSVFSGDIEVITAPVLDYLSTYVRPHFNWKIGAKIKTLQLDGVNCKKGSTVDLRDWNIDAIDFYYTEENGVKALLPSNTAVVNDVKPVHRNFENLYLKNAIKADKIRDIKRAGYAGLLLACNEYIKKFGLTILVDYINKKPIIKVTSPLKGLVEYPEAYFFKNAEKIYEKISTSTLKSAQDVFDILDSFRGAHQMVEGDPEGTFTESKKMRENALSDKAIEIADLAREIFDLLGYDSTGPDVFESDPTPENFNELLDQVGNDDVMDLIDEAFDEEQASLLKDKIAKIEDLGKSLGLSECKIQESEDLVINMHPAVYQQIVEWLDSLNEPCWHFEKRWGEGSFDVACEEFFNKTNYGDTLTFEVADKRMYNMIDDLSGMADEEGFHAEDYGYPESEDF